MSEAIRPSDLKRNIMRIIALYGHSNCGKSQTLNYLREQLRAAGKSISVNGPHKGDEPETFLYNGKVVCVAPGGDTGEIVKKNIEYFKSKNCDVAISASRCRGWSPYKLNQFAKDVNTQVEWYAKSYEYNLSEITQDMCNKESAQFLFEVI